jgi:hypothetical protein
MAVPGQLPAPSERLLPEVKVDPVKLLAAQLYGRGHTRPQIAKILAGHLASDAWKDHPHHADSMRYVRRKLRKWEMETEFRDLIYQQAVAELDLQVPDILEGVARQGKRGRVDAARLVLEVTGRHNPKGDQTPTNITIQIANVPRPE